MNKRTVLIVEDSNDYSDLLAEWLGAQYNVIRAGSLESAQAARKESNGDIDLILLDLGLPDSEGEKTLQSVGGNGETPVIVLSGEDVALSPADAVPQGGMSFIRKNDLRSPWPLISAIESAIAIQSLIDAVEKERAMYQKRSEIMAKGIGYFWTRMVRDFSLLYEFAREKLSLESFEEHLNTPEGIDPARKR